MTVAGDPALTLERPNKIAVRAPGTSVAFTGFRDAIAFSTFFLLTSLAIT
jgi:hypothetical protein